MIPAFSACTASPEPGCSTSTTVSDIERIPISLWPVPTVSMKTTSFPEASRRRAAWSVASARPPSWPRVPIERMKTPGSRKCSESRIRSPRMAPWVNGLVGSTEITPAVRPSERTLPTSAETRVDFPTPGAPVTPTTCARPVSGKSRRTSSRASGSPCSTSEIACASARVSPARTRSANSDAFMRSAEQPEPGRPRCPG